MRLTILAFLALAACTSPLTRVGPSLTDEERAYSLVWEGTYAMERESRPPTTWVPDCLNPPPRMECVISNVEPDGDIEITWMEGRLGAPRISNTPWPEALGAWRTYLLTGRRGNGDADLVRAAREALGQAGL
jgi:hypothetical protein